MRAALSCIFSSPTLTSGIAIRHLAGKWYCYPSSKIGLYESYSVSTLISIEIMLAKVPSASESPSESRENTLCCLILCCT